METIIAQSLRVRLNRHKLHLCFLLFIFLNFSYSIASNEIFFSRLDTKIGLPQIGIFSIYQDSTGVMWYASTEGLTRFNGSSAINYYADEESGLTENYLTEIYGEYNGSLFINARNKLVEFDKSTEKFKTFPENNIESIYLNNNTIWMVVNSTLKAYNLKNNSYKLYNNFEFLKNTLVNKLFVNKGVIYFCTTNGLFVFTKNTINHYLQGINFSYLLLDSNKTLWLGTKGKGLYHIDLSGNLIPLPKNTPEIINRAQVRSIVEDNYGQLWFGTFNGLFSYSKYYNKWSEYFPQEDVPYSVSHSSIYGLYKDKKGIIWVGTYFGGINYFNPQLKFFRFYGANTKRDNFLSSKFIGALTEDKKGNIWICTEGGGLNYFNRANDKISKVSITNNTAINLLNLKDIWLDQNTNKLYIGSHIGGMVVYNLTTQQKQFLQSNGTKQSILSNTITKFQSYKNSLFVLTDKGLSKMNLTDNLCYPPFKSQKLNQLVCSPSFFEYLYIDKKERLWLTLSAGGVICIDLKTEKYQIFKNEQGKSGSIGHQRVVSICETEAGELVFATAGSGIYVLNEKTSKFSAYTTKNSTLPSNFCYDIKFSYYGYLVVLHSHGFSFFNFKNNSCEYFPISNDVPYSGFYHGNRILYTKDGELLLTGIGGMIRIYEQQFHTYNKDQKISFDQLYISEKRIIPGDNSEILKKSLSQTQTIKLKHDQNNITIEFVSDNITNTFNMQFEYKLDGYDKLWRDATSTHNKIIYTNLPHGSYNLIFRGKNSPENSKMSNNANLKIIVSPPIYASTFAIIIYILLLTGVVYLIFRYFVEQTKFKQVLEFEKKDKDRIIEINQYKLRFFTNISHEFRTPLTLIIGHIEQLQKDDLPLNVSNSLTPLLNNAKRLWALVTELLDFRKQEQGSFKLRMVNNDIVNYCTEIVEVFAEEARIKKIDFQFIKPIQPLKIWFDPFQLQKAIINLISNAFKFTPEGGKIELTINEEDDCIKIVVSDNGFGIAEEHLPYIFERFYQADHESHFYTVGSGIGMAICKSIVELHHGEIKVDSKINEGTIFTIKLPKGSEHLSEIEKDVSNEQINWTIPKIISSANQLGYKDNQAYNASSPDKPTILIVDDNVELLNFLENVFETDYNVTSAINGEDALIKIRNDFPDLIVSDVRMPVMDGIQLCKRIKTDNEFSNIPIILLTAETSHESNIEGLLYGADDYIIKPFHIDILLAKCQNVIELRKKFYESLPNPSYRDLKPSRQNKLLTQIINFVTENLENENLSVEHIVREVGIGRSKFYLTVKELTNLTPNDFILSIRLNAAKRMFEENIDLNISEVAYAVGFSNPKYFSKLFKKAFLMLPSEIKRNK